MMPTYRELHSSPDPLPPIPTGVYYSPGCDNFYSNEGIGRGIEFWESWHHRRSEFPHYPSPTTPMPPVEIGRCPYDSWKPGRES